ncbi:MAG: DNA mismatch repair protein MutH [Polyangiales bacterium]
MIAPPASLEELAARVRALEGLSLAELAARHDVSASGPMLRRKGSSGQLVERALGANAGSRALPDFVELGVELKTIPVQPDGKPRESTFVCSFAVADADRADWTTSAVRKKLAHVLFVPLVIERPQVTLGRAVFWRPTEEQESILRADFDDLIGMIALGRVDALTAHHGHWLQVRPKAAHGAVRTRAYGPDGEAIATIPKGFYLRARVTGALLRDTRFSD